jgi:hypothetical protein
MASSIDKKILMLGSGMVVSPCLEYLARNPVNYFTVGELGPPHPHMAITNRFQHAELKHQQKILQPASLVLLPSSWTLHQRRPSKSTWQLTIW